MRLAAAVGLTQLLLPFRYAAAAACSHAGRASCLQLLAALGLTQLLLLAFRYAAAWLHAGSGKQQAACTCLLLVACCPLLLPAACRSPY